MNHQKGKFMEERIMTRKTADNLLKDPYRPGYHFAAFAADGRPGDPNGAFYADGRYHLMYLYREEAEDAFHWGHISSTDLLHWRNHPDALGSDEGDRGCFSGGAFVDDDQTAYLTFWKFASKDGKDPGGIDIAYSRPPYDEWKRLRPLAIPGSREIWGTKDLEIDGKLRHVGCADPSNIWKANGVYYMQTGNLCVLNTYGREAGSDPFYQGDWVDLFRSKDLKNWEYVDRFYQNPHSGEDWPDATEDDMCPSYLPLFDKPKNGAPTGKMLQLFIAHNKGTQYYVGHQEGERFIPESHGRMSWVDNSFFAPEALIDGENRHIAWCWLQDNLPDDFGKFGWSGVYTFPRVLWLEGDELRMAPAEELDRLMINGERFLIGEQKEAQKIVLRNPASFRLKAEIAMKDAREAGFVVRKSEDGKEFCRISVNAEEKKLVMELSHSGKNIREAAPFEIRGGKVKLDIFVDQSVVEVYADDRQGIARRIYPTSPEKSLGVESLGTGADYGEVSAWEMMPTNAY